MLAYLLRRLFFAVVVVATVAVLTYGIYRGLRPELHPGESLFGGVASDLARVFLHFDFGESCGNPGCPSIRDMWARSWTADLYLLVGGIAAGVLGGIAAAAWCAARPRTLSARARGLRRDRLLDAGLRRGIRHPALFEPRSACCRCRCSSTRTTTRRRWRTRGISCALWSCRGSSWRRPWARSACASRSCPSTRSPTPTTSAPPSRRGSRDGG